MDDPDSEDGAASDVTSSEDAPALSPDVLELDPVYEALGHPRRRYLCYTLLEDTEWSLTALARKIAAWEHDVAAADVTDEQRAHVYVSLYHAHVPKLVDEGVITFDEENERIVAAEHAAQVLQALRGMGASLDSDQEDHARGDE